MQVRNRWAAGAVALALMAAACGGGGTTGTGQGSDDGELEMSITAPEDGAEVGVPFTLEMSSSVLLDAPETGEHHVHVFFDGNESDYEVVESDTFEVTGLSAGEHSVTASLRNADHSPAGAEDEIQITVTAGGGAGDEKDGGGDGGGRGGGGYDY